MISKTAEVTAGLTMHHGDGLHLAGQQLRFMLGLASSAKRLEVAAAILFDDLHRFDQEPIVRGQEASERRLQALGNVLRSIGMLRDRYTDAAGSRNLDGIRRRYQLSPRETDVLGQLLSGLSEKQIALHLGLSRHTVHEHVKQIYRRMLVGSRAELMARFLPEGFAPIETDPPMAFAAPAESDRA